jgi:galactose mutarotase-like enzyme
MKLYGRQWSRRELEARFGRIEQIGGLRRVESNEGPEAGVEQIQVRTGAGLTYTVLPTRGMDIGLAEFGGAPLSWLSPAGEVHPAFFDDRGLGWLRTAAGGLLMTCGLTQVGSPGEEAGEALGLHGRAHHTPARQVAALGRWNEDEYEMQIQGQIEETSLFGHHLRLTRMILSTLGQNSLTIEDEVENLGFEPAPHMLLYHFNFGFPLMSEDTQITFPSRKVSPRDPDFPLRDLAEWPGPQSGYKERIYYHEELATDSSGWAGVHIRNPHFPLPGQHTGGPVTVRLKWDAQPLPVLIQWKMPGTGMHVLGIEPANCHVEGRPAERARGTLILLDPGQSLKYHLQLSIDNE